MRLYVEAYDDKGNQRLGNLDGQTVIHGDWRRSSRWRQIKRGPILCAPYIVSWRLVNDRGDILDTARRADWR